ncbi:MAG: hypothetical protein VX764_10490 [Planctomycetota bacterium]|nr:hypothetical protein [Planctomycetota bacterium]
MTDSTTQKADANRLLQAFGQQAQLYEQLLAESEATDLDARTLAEGAAKALEQARTIQNSVRDVQEAWGELSMTLDPQLRLEVDQQRKRLEEMVLAVISRHELLLEDQDQELSRSNEDDSQLRLLAE